MSVPSIDGRRRAEDTGPPSWHAPGGPAAFGFWATTGLAFAAIMLGFTVLAGAHYALIRLVPHAWFVPSGIAYLTEFLDLVFLVSILGALAWAVRRSGRSVSDYFALVRPTRRDLLLVLACTAVMWAVSNVTKSWFGWGVADFTTMDAQYREASEGGTVWLLWFAGVGVAPVAEETFFRGFLYRGWSQSRLDVAGAILLTSVIFGLLHYQYGWYGRCEVGFFAVLAGWLRWRSGSLIPPMLFHAAIGGSALLHTAV